MRDIALTLLIACLLPFVFKHPVLGAYLWAWLSMMNPHKLTFGFAKTLPFAQIVAVVAMLAFLGTRKRQTVPITGLTALWLLLIVWMSFTSFFAIADSASVVDRWVFVIKIHFMLLISMMLVCEPRQLKVLVWVVTLSVAFFGIKGGAYTIATAGGGRVWGPPGGLLQGNNELAVALTMLVPFMYWMRATASSRWVRHGLLVAMALCMVSVLGSQSRGAFLAVVATAFFLGIKSEHPVRMTALLAVGVLLAVGFMSDSWVDRMETIRTYQADGSAMSRIWTWTTLWNAAVDNPITGAGFRADSRSVFDLYSPKGEQWFIFEGRVYVAHSIYFQMLGEHGFLGLAIFLALWITVWVVAGRVGKDCADLPDLAAWVPLLMRMTQASLVGYAVGGAFLSLAYLDLPYYFMGYVILARLFVTQARARQEAASRYRGARDVHVAAPEQKSVPTMTKGVPL